MRLQEDAADASVEQTDAPTSDALLDLKKMKVAELKAELVARNLPTDGES